MITDIFISENCKVFVKFPLLQDAVQCLEMPLAKPDECRKAYEKGTCGEP